MSASGASIRAPPRDPFAKPDAQPIAAARGVRHAARAVSDTGYCQDGRCGDALRGEVRSQAWRSLGESPTRCSTDSTGTTASFARRAPGEGAFDAGRLARRATARQGADPLLRRTSRRVRRAARRLRRRRGRRDMAAGEAPLRRPADRPQAAGARRDVLQLGDDARAASHVPPRRPDLHARRGLDRVHPVRPAVYRSYYPHERGLRATFLDSLSRLRLEPPVRRPRARRRPRDAARLGELRRTGSAEPNLQVQVLGSAFYRNKAAYVVGRSSTATRSCRSSCRSCTTATGASSSTRSCSTGAEHRRPLLALARLLHGRHGRAVRLRRVPADDDRRRDPLRALHDDRARRSRARRSSTATCCHHLHHSEDALRRGARDRAGR